MDQQPAELMKGPKFLRTCINAIRRYAIGSRVESIIIRERLSNTEPLSATPRKTANGGQLWNLVVGGGGGTVVPFTPTDASVYNTAGALTTRKIKVSYGYVEDAIRSTIDGDGIWVPAGMTEADGLILTNSGDAGAVYLHVTNSVDPDSGKGEITALEIIAHSYDDDPLDADTGVDGYKYICDWETVNDRQRIVNGNGIGHQAWLYANSSFFWPSAVV